eukprot:GHVR01160685.1.p1 GENE.GHVR01160685.1~~GHVR01160685.1.p1  ORF type:complete len:185 (+),score=16.13 GHVR01160685.1:61-615(+)
MRIEKCWYCSSNTYPGHGIVFCRNDGKMFRFCRSKCHKHFKMKHNPRKSRWTKAHRTAANKELTMDSTFEFEKKRNRPVRYNRELTISTIKAMKIIDILKQRRRERFHMSRIASQREKNKSSAQKEISMHETLHPVIEKQFDKVVLPKKADMKKRVGAQSIRRQAKPLLDNHNLQTVDSDEGMD